MCDLSVLVLPLRRRKSLKNGIICPRLLLLEMLEQASPTLYFGFSETRRVDCHERENVCKADEVQSE